MDSLVVCPRGELTGEGPGTAALLEAPRTSGQRRSGGRQCPQRARSADGRRPASCRARSRQRIGDPQVADRWPPAESIDGGVRPIGLITRHRSALGREPEGGQHAVRDSFAVAEASIASHRLERMTDRVAEVQRAPRPGFALVRGRRLCLDAAAVRDDGASSGQPCVLSIDPSSDQRPVEQRPRRDDAVFDDFVQAGAEFARRQRPQHSAGSHTPATAVKRADQVLAGAQVHADLAADRAVHLRQQRRRHLNERMPRRYVAAAKPATSPTTPPPNAMTVPHDRGGGAATRRTCARRSQSLGAFAVGNEKSGARQSWPAMARMPAPYRAAADDRGSSASPRGHGRRHFREQAGPIKTSYAVRSARTAMRIGDSLAARRRFAVRIDHDSIEVDG